MNILSFTPFPTLSTERLFLRQLDENHAEEIFLLRSDEAVNKYLDRRKAESIKDAVQFIQKISDLVNSKQSLYWAITLKDELKLIGTILLFNFSENNYAEIGYELLPAYQGHGYMQEALQAVISFAFKNAGFKKIQAFTHEKNSASYRLLEKNNFTRDMKAEQAHAAKDETGNLIIYSLMNYVE